MQHPRPITYILDGHDAVPVSDLTAWSRWFASASEDGAAGRRVDETMVGDMWVSTVFLGADHQHGGDGDPVLFETMTFGDREEIQERYSTWAEAEAGHRAIVERLSR